MIASQLFPAVIDTHKRRLNHLVIFKLNGKASTPSIEWQISQSIKKNNTKYGIKLASQNLSLSYNFIEARSRNETSDPNAAA